jgi:hypothetical protein
VPLLRLLGRSPLPGSVLLKAAAVFGVTLAVGYALNDVLWWPATALLIAVLFVAGMHLARVPDRGGLIALFRDDETGRFRPINWRAPEPAYLVWRAARPRRRRRG